MITPLPDTNSDRAAFEAAISGPPYERDIARWPDDPKRHSWPGMYQEFSVALAWEMWQEAVKQERAGRPTVPPTPEGIPEPMSARRSASLDELEAVVIAYCKECAAQAHAQALKDPSAQECDALASIEEIAQRCAEAVRALAGDRP